jgi:hypothetical protein
MGSSSFVGVEFTVKLEVRGSCGDEAIVEVIVGCLRAVDGMDWPRAEVNMIGIDPSA